jgi:hypothetical protein
MLRNPILKSNIKIEFEQIHGDEMRRTCTTIFQLIFKSNKLKKFFHGSMLFHFFFARAKEEILFTSLLLFREDTCKEFPAAFSLIWSINQGILKGRDDDIDRAVMLFSLDWMTIKWQNLCFSSHPKRKILMGHDFPSYFLLDVTFSYQIKFSI